MEMIAATTAFAALGHADRLAVLRLLVATEPEGLPAGDIAAALNLRPNTLSGHLNTLRRAGLICQRREGRIIRCHAAMPALAALIDYLTEDCCGGRPTLCRPEPR